MKRNISRNFVHNPLCSWPTTARTAISFLLFVICALTSCSPVIGDDGNFNELAIEIADYGLFDLGIADINNDDRLDIFTVNHSGRQSLQLNNGSGTFSDVFSAWKMDQDQQFPGLVVRPKEPQIDQPGLYINWVGPRLLVRAHHSDKVTPILGRIEVLSAVKITDKQNFNVEVTVKELSSNVVHSIIKFSGEEEGYFIFEPLIHALPIQFHFDAGLVSENIHVGPNLISPASGSFAVKMRDRHGTAWADFNDDDRMDVFITRGGLRGTMENVPLDFWDELLLGTPNGMEDMGKTLGLAKNGCPGRQAAWVDFDGDNRLDLYVVCGRGAGSYPNKLYQQTSEGNFIDVAEKVGLDIGALGSFLWLDADLDDDMDLFWSDARGFFFYKNEAGIFSPTHLLSRRPTVKLTSADFDNDGDLDIFSASPAGNVLFINTGNTFSAVTPLSVGLPKKSRTANWVDYQNNGLLDLHTVPNGLYVQKQKGKFTFTSQLKIDRDKFSPFRIKEARTAWFDADNNGSRDLLLAKMYSMKKAKWAKRFVKITGLDERFGGLDYYWKSLFLTNENTNNHWLQVQLTGPPGNRPAIGALVTLKTANGKQLQQVGGSEGSHYSQGHYRIYFGLGQHPGPFSLTVNWPDGKLTELANPKMDRLLKITWQDS